MDPKQKSGLTRTLLKRGGWINNKGPMTTLWDDFRAKKLKEDLRNEDTITCQCWKLGLPTCNQKSSSPDLHHILGRDERPDLYFSNNNLVWLVRSCHEKIHNNPHSTSTETKNDSKRSLEATPQRDAILGVQGQFTQEHSRNFRPKIHSDIQHTNAKLMERGEENEIR